MLNKFFYFSLIIFLIPGTIIADYTPCPKESNDMILASASTWDNLRNSDKSIKFKISQLINTATNGKSEENFTIQSIPNKILGSYTDKAYCETKLLETIDNKLLFTSPKFKSLDELNSWIGDFSQGKGADGAQLYQQCDKTCSPSYEYKISFRSEPKTEYEVKALVICGHARDKDDNQYSLSLTCD
jgi:hypothetical protein